MKLSTERRFTEARTQDGAARDKLLAGVSLGNVVNVREAPVIIACRLA
jgi:hypothetical protein